MRKDQLTAASWEALFTVHRARTAWRLGRKDEAAGALRTLSNLNALGQDQHALLLSVAPDHDAIESLLEVMSKDAWVAAIDHVFRDAIDVRRVASLERLVRDLREPLLVQRFYARLAFAYASGALEADEGRYQDVLRRLEDGPMGEWARRLDVDTATRSAWRELTGKHQELDRARMSAMYALDRGSDDHEVRQEQRRRSRAELKRSLDALAPDAQAGWNVLMGTEFEIESRLSSDAELAAAMHSLFEAPRGHCSTRHRLLFKQSYVAWRRLRSLEEARSDPDLESIGGLLVSFRTVLEKLLHEKITRTVELPSELGPGKIKDATEDRTTLGIGHLYGLIYKSPKEQDARAFHEAVRGSPALKPLLTEDARERYRQLQRVNLSGAHHDEREARAAWREIFSVVRWAMFDELALPDNNDGLVRILVALPERRS